MSSIEKQHLIISWLTISIAFSWVLGGFSLSTITSTLPVTLIAVGTGFVLHELAHKYTAMHFGAHAEYRMWTNGLIFALILALFLKIVFAAPGAVYIYGPHINRKQNGIISFSGILTNILVGLLFLVLSISGFFYREAFMIMYINFFLAFFNLLPFPPLDGSKVFAWNKKIWAIAFIPLLVAMVFIFK